MKWEVEIKVRRNGRLVEKSVALGSDPEEALYFANNDLERWCQSHPERIAKNGKDEATA